MNTQMLSGFKETMSNVKNWFQEYLGDAGNTILICMLSVTALLLLWNMAQGFIGKTKLFKDGKTVGWFIVKLILLAVNVGVLVWLCLMY